jgi:hypothetical protein
VLCNWCEVWFVLEAKYDYPGSVAQIQPDFKFEFHHAWPPVDVRIGLKSSELRPPKPAA